MYAWQHDESKHGPPEESIPCQLQRLFARLQLSTRMAVDTTDLTRSFGWAAADACRQQDVQELLHVLFDALDRCVAAQAVAAVAADTLTRARNFPCSVASAVGSSAGASLTSMFAGTLVDSLQSTECAHARSRVDPFLDVKLNSIGCGTVEAALRQFTTPEELVCSLCCAECAYPLCA